MDAAEVLFRMLDRTCPREELEGGGLAFEYNLHCGLARILARELGDGQWSIVSIKFACPCGFGGCQVHPKN